MPALCGSSGSSANSMRPRSLSYPPVDPNDRPSAITRREAIVTFVTSADVESGRSRTHNSTNNQHRITITITITSIEVSAERSVKRSVFLMSGWARGPAQEHAQRLERRSGLACAAAAEDTLPIVRDGIDLTVADPQHAAAKQFPCFAGLACRINGHRQIHGTERWAICDVE